jgi:hypothetical protein
MSIETGQLRTWYLIGVGGGGCNIIDDFFSQFENNFINIKKMTTSFKDDSGLLIPRTLAEHVLTKSVPGHSGWWVFNTSYQDLDKMHILGKKLDDYRTQMKPVLTSENSEITQKIQSDPDVGTFEADDDIYTKMKKELNPRKRNVGPSTITERYAFTEKHFMQGREGAGKWWILGEENVFNLLDEEEGIPRIQRILDDYEKGAWRNSNAVLIVHALGRGTGSGSTGRIIDAIKQIRYKPRPVDVVTISVLPDYHKADTRYRLTVVNALFGLISILQTKEGQRLADNIILVHNVMLEELSKRKRPAFVYSDKLPLIGNRLFRRVNPKKINTQAYNGLIVDLIGLLCSGNLLTKDSRAFDVNNLIEWTNNLPNRIEPDIPTILIPAVYISSNKKSKPSDLISSILQRENQWIYMDCDPESAKGLYPLLFFNNKRNRLSSGQIFDEVENTVKELYPKFKGELCEPDYIDTAGSFSACLLFLVEPKIPILDTYFEITNAVFEQTANYKSYTVHEASSNILEMKKMWDKSYKKRAQLLIDIINNRRGE